MVGQRNNLEFINTSVANNSLPRFMIITGARGSGRQTLAKYIAKTCLNAYQVYPGIGVNDVRAAIDNAYRCGGVTVYIFPNADKMSAQAKNALLKVTEEPPRLAYFILIVESIHNTLPTLKSRGTEIIMETYSTKELREFKEPRNKMEELALQIATTPGQYLELIEIDADKFFTFSEKVLNNIAVVTGVNAFKIGQHFKFKAEDKGYDPILFFECIKYICATRAKNTTNKQELTILKNVALCSSKYSREFALTGVKKDSTFDMWILDVRDICTV